MPTETGATLEGDDDIGGEGDLVPASAGSRRRAKGVGAVERGVVADFRSDHDAGKGGRAGRLVIDAEGEFAIGGVAAGERGVGLAF